MKIIFPIKQLTTAELNQRFLKGICDENLSQAQKLLDQGANINTKAEGHKTPLMWCAIWGCVKSAKFLIKNQALLEEKDYYHYGGTTAFLFAAEHGNIPMIELLQKSGANTKARNNYGETAVMLAAKNEHIDTVSF